MNIDDNEPIIDAMLDEWLGKRKPRPISVNALSRQSIDPQRAAEFEQSLQAAAAANRKRPTISRVSIAKKSKPHSSSYRVLASLAASLVLAGGVWTYSNRNQLASQFLNQSLLVTNQNDGDKSLVPIPEVLMSAAPVEGKSTQGMDSTHSIASKRVHETLPIESLPFSTQGNASSTPNSSGSRAHYVAKLTESETIAAIDSQTQKLWKNHDAKPAAPVASVAWIDRVCKQLLARPATQDDKEAFAKKDNPSLRLAALHRIVDSPEFSQVWAKSLAAHYLGVSGPISTRDITHDRRGFVQWIRREMSQGHGLDSIAKNIVLAGGIDANKEELPPSSYWWAETGMRSPETPTNLLASKFLGTQLSCSRCHDANKVANANPSQYWGIAAITHGVEVVLPPGSEKPSIGFRNGVKPLFYEKEDSSLVAAIPMLPNGKELTVLTGEPSKVRQAAKQNLNAFAHWMLESDEFTQSQANFVWQSMFGEPLIAVYPFDASEGSNERQEIAQVLSQQLRANDYDLRQIVVWIAASQAFSLDSVRPDNDWYLKASDKDLRSLQQRQRLMASFPVRQDQSFRSLDKLAQWIDSSSLHGKESGAVLANPVPLNPATSKSIVDKSGTIKKAASFTEAQVQFLVDSQTLPIALQEEVDRMLKQNMPWNVLVDHAFYMTGSLPPTASDREAAQRILDLTRDKRLALARIIASRL